MPAWTPSAAVPSSTLSPSAGENEVKDVREPPYHPRRVIVEYEPNAAARDISQARALAKTESARTLGPRGKDGQMYWAHNIEVLTLEPGISVESAIVKLNQAPGVVWAQPDYQYEALFTPNDPYYYPNQWHLNNAGQTIMGIPGTPGADIKASSAWDVAASATTTKAIVAVIDTGVDSGHPDITPNLLTNLGEIPNNGLDDDNNGYVDDYVGLNWANWAQWRFGSGRTYLGGTAPHYSEVAESFVGHGGKLSGIWVNLYKYGSPSESVTVSIRSNRTGPDLTSFIVSPSSVPDQSLPYWSRWISRTLPSPLAVTDGSTYYLVIGTANNDAVNRYAIGNSNGINAFPDGNLSVNDGSWTDLPTYDMTFELVADGQTGNGGRPHDDNSHGTHVSGIAAAATNNGIGVAGVSGYPAGTGSIMPLRALDTQGSGYTTDIIAAINYAADNGADVINMSLSGSGYSSAMQAAVNYATSQGVFVVAAAGNTGSSGMRYPAGYSNVTGVAATTNQNERASFSTYNSSVDLAAPGVNIYSTMPTYATYDSEVWGASLNYDWMSGTSMSAPIVAGVGAMIRSIKPSYAAANIALRLQNTALHLGPSGRNDLFGWGLVNAFAALQPVTSLSTDPSNPNGNNEWFTSIPTITLTPDETATTYYSWDSTASMTTYSGPFPANSPGARRLYYYSIDGLISTETVQNRVFKVDTSKPTGSIAINGGATYARSRSVTLALTAVDAVSGLDKMQFMNSGGSWSSWESVKSSKSWSLSAPNGSKRVYYRISDMAGNTSEYSDTIFLDTAGPDAELTTPFVSTKISKRPSFEVGWSATDPSPGSGIDSYMVRYRAATSSTWTDWKADTKSTSGVFPGVAGVTYYFRVKATDNAGNTGWSKVRKTIVPYNQGSKVFRRRGFKGYYENSRSRFYLSSVRYSYTRGNELVYKISGASVGLVSTKYKNRGLAKIYIDGRYVKTIDAYSRTFKPRQLVFYTSWTKKGTHFLKIVNLGTPGRARFDVDAIVEGQL